MRSASLSAARAILLAGPVVLAFFSGGYFGEARAWAGLAAWLLVAVAAIASKRPWPRTGAARLAVAALGGLAAWTLLSATWAPLAGPAYHDAQRVTLYAGVLLAATALLTTSAARRAVEPVSAAGALIVVGYGISERLAPWLITLHRSRSAFGRLEQPLTYWNAMGAVAALGVVLCARLAGDPRRPVALRAAAGAAAAPLGMGLYVTFSRGAVFACTAGLVVLAIAAPTRVQLRGGAVVVLAALAGALIAAPFAGVTHLSGHARDGEGTAALLLLAAVAIAAAASQREIAAREARGAWSAAALRLPRHAPWLASVAVVGGFAVFLAVGNRESRGATNVGPGAQRFATLQSNRYDYWRVAWRLFEHHPLAGAGASGFAPEWLRRRPFAEGAHDAHSLYIETAAELGLVGLALLAGLLAGIALSARDVHDLAPAVAAGPMAGAAVWAAHVAVDWDWEMPAATLPALLLAGLLLAAAQ